MRSSKPFIAIAMTAVLSASSTAWAQQDCDDANFGRLIAWMHTGSGADVFPGLMATARQESTCMSLHTRQFLQDWSDLWEVRATVDYDEALLALALDHANRGLPHAQYLSAKLYGTLSISAPHHTYPFFTWLITAAQNDHAQARYEIAEYIEHESDNLMEAHGLFVKAAQQGHFASALKAAFNIYFLFPEQREKSIPYFEIAARDPTEDGLEAKEYLCLLSTQNLAGSEALGSWCAPHTRPSAE